LKINQLFFENLIKSDLIYVNDIVDPAKTLSSKLILEKLKLKSNWIADFNIVNKSIPKNWINITKTENSVKSTVNNKRNRIIWKNTYIETSFLSNKMLYNSLLFFNKIESSIGVDKWVKVLNIQEKPFMKPLYQFIFFIFGRKQTENI
jgi:predicted transcriptional regulator